MDLGQVIAEARAKAVSPEEKNATCSRCRNNGDRYYDCTCASACDKDICPMRIDLEACWLWNASALAPVPRFVH